MTDDELRAIEERAAKATPGPWTIGEENEAKADVRLGRRVIFEIHDSRLFYPESYDTREFIIHAREDVPALTAEIRRLKEELRNLGWYLSDVL